MVKHHQTTSANQEQEEEEDIYNILLPNVGDLPLTPPSAVQSNFISYFAPDFLKPRHDQYVYRHTNGLCVIGLTSTHLAFKEQEGGGGGITAVDFNKRDEGPRKTQEEPQILETNSVLSTQNLKKSASFTPPRASISSESKSIDGVVASSRNLWALIMDVDTGFSSQDWIMEQWEKNYYISSIVGATNGSSLVVMSEGTPYTEQSYKVSESFLYKWINKKWKEGFHVTSMTTAGN
ncbi:hypothetical protein F8388_002669 [Cannabis sativa]|uniref:DUF7477 domain-containing protein n=1 Tax=Cannabis sativa TaxID=3483 RepID=A0A7J6FBT7_CANSA|nr:hypothetical protein F8388_002669 [Cannabis sativa]